MPTVVESVQTNISGLIGGLCAVGGVLFFTLIFLWKVHNQQVLIMERLGMLQELKAPAGVPHATFPGPALSTRQPNAV
jgi:hypothetical protein